MSPLLPSIEQQQQHDNDGDDDDDGDNDDDDDDDDKGDGDDEHDDALVVVEAEVAAEGASANNINNNNNNTTDEEEEEDNHNDTNNNNNHYSVIHMVLNLNRSLKLKSAQTSVTHSFVRHNKALIPNMYTPTKRKCDNTSESIINTLQSNVFYESFTFLETPRFHINRFTACVLGPRS